MIRVDGRSDSPSLIRVRGLNMDADGLALETRPLTGSLNAGRSDPVRGKQPGGSMYRA